MVAGRTKRRTRTDGFTPYMLGMIDVMGKAARIRDYERRRAEREGHHWFEWKLTEKEAEVLAKEKAKEQAKKAKAKPKLSEINCPKCRHSGVIKYAQKVHPEDTKKPDKEMRYVTVYRCKTCLHEFTLKEDKPVKPAKPKETPHEKEVRVLKEKLDAEKAKFKQQAKMQSILVKENKALKDEVKLLKSVGIFPKGIPGQPKKDPEKDRFANLDL